MENTVEPSNNPTVAIRDLSVAFSGKTVLKSVNLVLWPGQLTVIVGPSGSGKSTLLRALNRLNELFPGCRTQGDVSLRVDGRCGNVYEGFLPLPELRRKVGMVFQTPSVLPFSIRKNLAMPLKATMGITGTALAERIEMALGEVSLWEEVKERLDENASTLSGGQQQRLCLARALALEPQILLLDEPTASLDFRATQRIEELLKSLKERYTILAVSHSLSQTRRLADKVHVLREGRIEQEMVGQHLQDRETFEKLVEDVF
jgi:phosphate transport system ATP-binding protein